jgi:DNA-binding NarL/FixJ family response regulator
MREILSDAVEAVAGLELTVLADNPEDAICALDLHHPDVVVLDLVLKGGNGLDVLRKIKLRTPGCRVLVFTAYDAEQYRTRCLAAGADHFFSKNRQHHDLLQLLNTLAGEPPAPELAKPSGKCC